jgi:competence protein ComFB
MSQEKFVLANYMEMAVEHYFPNVKKSFPDICDCEHCTLDIKAIALNNLKPHYVVTESGRLWTKIEEMKPQFEVDVMKALIDAIAKVSVNPRHTKNGEYAKNDKK